MKESLGRVGLELRKVMGEYVRSEMMTAAANKDLPPGAAPIPSIEFERKGELQPPKTAVRHFKAFVYGLRRIAEQGYVQAAQRSDGKWEVFIPGGATSSGDYLTCDLIDFVEVVTEEDATPWPENLAAALSVPAFYVTERAWWKFAGPHDHILFARTLQELQSLPPHHFEPRVSTRVVRLEDWRAANPDVGETEPPPALAAE